MLRPRSPWPARLLVVASVALSLLPLARLTADLSAYLDLGLPLKTTPQRGYDGVRWIWGGDGFQADHVAVRSPADRAGVRVGDGLRRIDYVGIESHVELRQQVERATGTVLAYELQRPSGRTRVDVAIVPAPTFLYPQSPGVWAASAWGFGIATFVHVLALLIVLPVAGRARRARRAALLIGAALAWVGGNLARIAWVAATGRPGGAEPLATAAFDVLTLVALGGWTLFPALLLHHVLLSDRRLAVATRRVRGLVWIPPAVLGGGIGWATLTGHVGPLPPDAFVVPVLFYVSVTVATATALSLIVGLGGGDHSFRAPVWSRIGSALVLAVALGCASVVWFSLPQFRPDAGIRVEAFVTGLQLMSVLPVGLVSLSTLRYGPVDVVIARGLAALATLAGVFAVVAGGTALLNATLPAEGPARSLVLALFLVGVLVVVNRLAPAARRLASRFVRPERRASSAALDQFTARLQTVLDPAELADEASKAVGAAFRPESAVVFLRAGRGTPTERWVQGGYRPSPPFFTADALDRLWGDLSDQDGVWSRNPELREASLRPAVERRLSEFGVALTVPVATPDGDAAGLLVLGRRPGLRVYTTSDVARLRTLGVQLALAAERLALIERETALVRQTAEAELTALRAQINPHFLFNALNTVSALIRERPEEAEATLQSLAGLFRDVLTASGKPSIPLRDELRLVRRYLDVEQARFGDKLDVEIDVEPAALDGSVPAFAVQTLVENAVKHGIERKRGGGEIRIAATMEGDRLTLTVRDTGPGIPALFGAAGPVPGHTVSTPAMPVEAPTLERPFYGVGLSNVHDRLQQLYGPGAWLRLESAPEATVATLTLP